jgi:hypothetical protein
MRDRLRVIGFSCDRLDCQIGINTSAKMEFTHIPNWHERSAKLELLPSQREREH